jgi:hypothetical protein
MRVSEVREGRTVKISAGREESSEQNSIFEAELLLRQSHDFEIAWDSKTIRARIFLGDERLDARSRNIAVDRRNKNEKPKLSKRQSLALIIER